MLKVKLDTNVQPTNERNKEDATEKLYRMLEQLKQLSKDLSNKLYTELEVDKVYKHDNGGVIIELLIKEFTELENIKSLSETGVLSHIFGSLLLIPEYLSSCLADKVHIDAKVDDRSFQALMAYARGNL